MKRRQVDFVGYWLWLSSTFHNPATIDIVKKIIIKKIIFFTKNTIFYLKIPKKHHKTSVNHPITLKKLEKHLIKPKSIGKKNMN
jgi:hypothetical protein